MKKCVDCKVDKDLSEFHLRRRKYKDKVYEYPYGRCKVCSNKLRRIDFAKNMHQNAKSRANRRGIEFDITVEDIRELNDSQDGKCAFTGVPLNWDWLPPSRRRICPPDRVSLDRIDSSKGYVVDNIQLTTDIVNRCKGQYADSEFITMCKLVTEMAIE